MRETVRIPCYISYSPSIVKNPSGDVSGDADNDETPMLLGVSVLLDRPPSAGVVTSSLAVRLDLSV